MVAIFIVSEIGERMTSVFILFNESLYQSDWYTFPVELRRIFTMVLANAQKPVIVQGYASTYCVREYFRLVTIYSQKSIKFQSKIFMISFDDLFFHIRPFGKASTIS